MAHRILLAVSIHFLIAADWPAYRGPTGDGHAAADAKPPLRWSDTESVRWKTAIHDRGWSSPVILGEQIWMTTAREDGTQLFAVCVDRDSGKIVHDVKVFDVAKPMFCHPFNSYASPTPVLEPGRVYVHFGSAGTACLDAATGKTLWERRDLPCDHHRGPGSSPIIHENLLIVAYDGFDVQYVAALDKHTGKTVWKTDRNFHSATTDGDLKKAYATAAVFKINGRDELVCPSAEASAAYDPKTGRELWRVVHGGMNAALRPLLADGRIILTTGYSGLQLAAVKPGGEIAWSYAKGVPTRSSPILVDGRIYFVHDGGMMTAVRPADGIELQKLRLGGNHTSSPIYAGGHLYFCDQDGAFFVVKPGAEATLVATNKLPAGCMASPAALGKALLVRTKTHLYRIEEKKDG